MQGAAHWLTGFVVLGGGAGVYTAMRVMAGRGHRRLAQREVMCPRHKETFDCTLTMSTVTGACIDVDSCAHFDPPERVTCERHCLREINGVSKANS